MLDTDTRLLIAADNLTDAETVRRQLSEEYQRVTVSYRQEQWVEEFDQQRPQILVLAFRSLAAAEAYNLGLYRHSRMINVLPHRTLLLCHKDELRAACNLCRRDNFDDYVLFWPMAHDGYRLSMSLHLARRALTDHQTKASLAQLSAQARRIAELEKLLDQQLARGHAHVENATQVLQRTQGQVSAALDDFSQRLLATGLDNALQVNDAQHVQREFGRLNLQAVAPGFDQAEQSLQPMRQWVGEVKSSLDTPLQAARVMTEQSRQLRPLVLVIDDDKHLRKLLTLMLGSAGYDVEQAEDGVVAATTLRRCQPDLILMDVRLPDVDGIELTRRLKSAPPVSEIPVIMLTGQGEKNVIMDSLAAGAADFVVKPFDREVLLKKVARLVSA